MKRFFENQFPNLFLWTPFLITAGAVVYFSLPFEPIIKYPILISVLLVISALRIGKSFCLLTSALCLLFGFFYSYAFTHFINTPKISRDVRNAQVSGQITNIDYTDQKSRLYIKSDIGLVRVSTDLPLPKIGDTVSATVSLYPPDLPSAPGAFDYSRWAYFNKITATGYLTEYEITSRNDTKNINTLRDYIHSKTNSFLSDTLILGYKNAVPRADTPIWTATGVGHVWSISGFHITLVGGFLFIIFYCIFRSISPITKRVPARYHAVIASWLGLLFYLFLSGLDVATIRAFIMTSLVFAAILAGRNAFSMRFVAIAFIVIFLMNPHFVMQPGFQLSFAAIFGLVRYFENRKYKKKTRIGRFAQKSFDAGMTSVIATFFTAPFVAYHFYSLPLYGLVGNLLLLPIFSFLIMPLVMFGTITALFDYTMSLRLAACLYDWTLLAATYIADIPFSTVQIPYVSGTALLLMTFGMLCLILIRGKYINWILCVVFLSAGIAAVAYTPRPVFYTTSDNELVGFVNNNGKLEFNKARAANHYFAFDSWKHLNFEPTGTPNIRRKCDKGVCKFGNITYIQKFVPLVLNLKKICNDKNTKYIVSHFKVDAPNCKAKFLHGGFVIYADGKIKYTTINRKWHR